MGHPNELTFLSWREGSTTWKIGRLLQTLTQEIDLKLRVVPKVDSSGGISLTRSVGRGEYDLVATYPHSAKWAYEGTFAYEGERLQDLRAIAFINRPSWFVVAVARETHLENFSQIKDQKYPLKLVITSRESLTGLVDTDCFYGHGLSKEQLLSWGGQIFEIFKDVNHTQVGSFLRDGKANAIATYGEPVLRFWQEASVWRDLNFISLESSVIDSVANRYGVQKGIIDSGTFRGQNRDILTVAYPGWVVVCRKDFEENIAYQLAELLDTNSEFLASSSGRFAFNGYSAVKNTGIPLHSGSLRYYKDRMYIS